ncbi:MAG: hypothetical protein SOX56_07250 [[Pasteurella] mairii]|uniref:Uncharacterized protein n=1 Tax=[Pasteurella] mairii TaxID=757 RepID=A0A379B4Y8_9PAST|nr:hypothetical protein [[Pasteurella] mairii]SUB33319.1 Uncharacterised protein [[Pasteurella] mairii]
MADGINTAIKNVNAVYKGAKRGTNGVVKPHFKLHTTAAAANKTRRNVNRRKSMGGSGG